MTELLTAAKEYASIGWRVLPILPDPEHGTKKPPVSYKNLRHAEPEVFPGLFQKYPQCKAIAKIVSDNEIVIDIDGGEWPEMPVTPTLQTVRGYHYHFKRPLSLKMSKSQIDFEDGMEVKGPGMLANVPPGEHPSGFKYQWIHGPETPLAELPGWITDKINKYSETSKEGKKMSSTDLDGILQGVKEGDGRNKACIRLGGHYIGKGLEWPEIKTILTDWNQKNSPPMAASELERCLKSLENMHAQRLDEHTNGKKPEECSKLMGALVERMISEYVKPGKVQQGKEHASANAKAAWKFVKENKEDIKKLEPGELTEFLHEYLKHNFFIFGAVLFNIKEYCTKKSENKESEEPVKIEDKYPAHILDLASKLLEQGDPMSFILDTWHQRHIGDRELGEALACAVSSTYLTTTQGLHIKPHGPSGKGKSDAIEKFLQMIPQARILNGSLSGKSAFYNPHLKKGTIIYSDDVQLNPDIVTTIKQATSKYQSKTLHSTVKNQDHAEYKIPERICWMLSSVDGFDDDQLSNRFLGLDVDATQAQDRAVNQKQRELRRFGVSKETVDDSILICRAMYDILGQEEYKILIPYIYAIQWLDIQNRRNFEMFCDILISVTFYRIKQREKLHDAYLAGIEDFYTAKSIYKNFAEFNHTKLTKKETDILNVLSSAKGEPVEFKEIQKKTKIAESTLRKDLDGTVKDGGGLTSKIPGLYKEVIDEDLGERGRTRKTYYSFEGSLKLEGVESYFDIVDIDESRVQAEVEKWKLEYNEFINQKSNSRGTIIAESYQNHSTIIDSNNIKSSTVDRVLNNIAKCTQNVTKGCVSESVCDSKKESISLVSEEKQEKTENEPVDTDNVNGECYDSAMIVPCVPMRHSDSASAYRNAKIDSDFFARVAQEFETKHKTNVNSSNLEKFVIFAWMRFGQAQITNISRESLTDYAKHYFKLSKVPDTEIIVHTPESAKAAIEEMLKEA